MRVAPVGGTAVQDHVALAEIELCGELIIAASAAEDRLSLESIDEVLKVAEERARAAAAGAAGAVGGAGARGSPLHAPAPAQLRPRRVGPVGQVRSSRPIAFVASSTF